MLGEILEEARAEWVAMAATSSLSMNYALTFNRNFISVIIRGVVECGQKNLKI